MSPRSHSLVIGLDGADLEIVQSLGRRELPNLYMLMQRGAYAAVRSVKPSATLPNWTTLLTGVNPGVHGVFDFTTRIGYQVRFTAGSIREAPTIAYRLDKLGMVCACIDFPATWPPERLKRGIFISGWDAPVAFEADDSFVWPPGLYREIRRRFGRRYFDDVNEFQTDGSGWHDLLPEKLIDRIERKTEMAIWLLSKGKWDLFAIYFGESDTAAHHLWACHDPLSPRHSGLLTADPQGLSRVYRALDQAIGRLVECAGGERVEVTVVSDHGSGGTSDKLVYLNRFLQEAGFLKMHRGLTKPKIVSYIKNTALTQLPPSIRERLYRVATGTLPNLLESTVRFGHIDMAQTLLFSDEINYFPAIHYNLYGREPSGILDARDLPTVRRELENALQYLRDPWTGESVVANVYSREELYKGPFVHRAPDLVLEFNLSLNYSYNLVSSSKAPIGTGHFRRLAASEYLSQKGHTLSGSHRARGLFIAAGPRVKSKGFVQAEMADVPATILSRMQIENPNEFAGHCLDEILYPTKLRFALPRRTLPESKRRQDQARVQARLKALGYIE